MKKIVLLPAFALSTLLAAAQKPNAFIKASMPGIPSTDWVYYRAFSGEVRDSVKPDAKGFSISLSIPEGEGDLYMIQIGKKYEPGKMVFVFCDKGTVRIKNDSASFINASYSGTKAVNDYDLRVTGKKRYWLKPGSCGPMRIFSCSPILPNGIRPTANSASCSANNR